MTKQQGRMKSARENNKAFTLIELIVVMAVIGILILLGVPKLVNYVQEAKYTQIIHDVKVMEAEMAGILIEEEETFHAMDDNAKDLNKLVLEKKLYETKGYAKNVENFKLREVAIKPQTLASNSPMIMGFGANILGDEPVVTETKTVSGYKIVPHTNMRNIKTKLTGTFYANKEGKVYYEPDKPFKKMAQETQLECVAPEPIDYEFDHLTGTIVKYTGNLQHLVIPNSFKVDGQCYPVLIIGRGAFMQGGYKTIVIPESVKKIEEDAFKGNDLKDIVIPESVDTIGQDAFRDNKLTPGIVYPEGQSKPGGSASSGSLGGSGGRTSSGLIIKGDEGDIIIGVGAFDDNGEDGKTRIPPKFVISTDKEAGIKVTVSKDGKGTITGYTPSGGPGTGNPGGNSTGNSVVIPPKVVVDGKEVPIEEVETGAYQGKGLISVVMPDGLKRIEDYAFAGNQLIVVNIPLSVEHIGNYAFAFNELEKIGSFIGADFIPTIKNINIQNKEYINKLDKYGNIVSGNKKVAILDNKVALLDFIFATEDGDIVSDVDDSQVEEGQLDVDHVNSLIDNLDKTVVTAGNMDVVEQLVKELNEEYEKLCSKSQKKVKGYDALISEIELALNTVKAKETNDLLVTLESLTESGVTAGNLSQVETLLRQLKASYGKLTIEQQKLVKNYDNVVSQIQSSIEKLQKGEVAPTGEFIPEGYRLATDNDFEGARDGSFRYKGKSDYVVIPHVIKGVPVTSYHMMFMGTLVKGLASDNTNIISMQSMFHDSQSRALDLSFLDTSSVTNMSGMFNLSKTTYLNMPFFDTSKVTNMGSMFNDAHANSLDLSSFDTSSVTNMNNMFQYNRAKTINLSSFDTTKVKEMNRMFRGSDARTLDLSSFDVSNVWSWCTDRMFDGAVAWTGYARTQADAKKLNESPYKSRDLTFIVK